MYWGLSLMPVTLELSARPRLGIEGVFHTGTQLYPESTTLITEIEAASVQLKPETYIEWSIALTLVLLNCFFPFFIF